MPSPRSQKLQYLHELWANGKAELPRVTGQSLDTSPSRRQEFDKLIQAYSAAIKNGNVGDATTQLEAIRNMVLDL